MGSLYYISLLPAADVILGREYPGASATWTESEKKSCKKHRRAGITNPVARLEPARANGKNSAKGVANFDTVLVESNTGDSLQ